MDPAMKAIDEKRRAQEERVPEGIREKIKRGERPGAKTGPKGVMADYKAFKRAEYDQKALEKVRIVLENNSWTCRSSWRCF